MREQHRRTWKSAAIVLAAGLLVAMGGCSAGAGGGERDSRALTAEEIQASDANNLYEVIQRERPRWLQSRGSRSMGAGLDDDDTADIPTEIHVWLNDSHQGEAEQILSSFPPDGVERIEYLSASEADALGGSPQGVHLDAAIMLYTSR